MRWQWAPIIALLLISGLLLAGCGRKRAVRPPAGKAPAEQQAQEQRKEEEAGPPRTPTSVKVEKPTVKVADPKGQWTFTAEAQTMTAASAEGPYTMRQATGVYERKGQPPVHMKADQIIVDKGAKRVTLIGSVRLSTPTMQVEGPRIEYNLDTQQVRAGGPTKMTYSRTAVGRTAGNRESGIENRGQRVTARRPLPGGLRGT
jgi:LPS export ABC transporter protein LptC